MLCVKALTLIAIALSPDCFVSGSPYGKVQKIAEEKKRKEKLFFALKAEDRKQRITLYFEYDLGCSIVPFTQLAD